MLEKTTTMGTVRRYITNVGRTEHQKCLICSQYEIIQLRTGNVSQTLLKI